MASPSFRYYPILRGHSFAFSQIDLSHLVAMREMKKSQVSGPALPILSGQG